MTLLGLTGGIGMGKTTAAHLLQERGWPVIDTDVLAREVVEPGQPAYEEIQKAFGPSVVGQDRRVRRDELARLVFSDEALRKKLESIVHPRIQEGWLAQVETWRIQGQPHGVVVIPLLFETNAAGFFDTIVCAACSKPTQQHRLLARGWTPEQIQQRLQAQWPVERKIALAHYLIWTEGGLDIHAGQIDRILRTLAASA